MKAAVVRGAIAWAVVMSAGAAQAQTASQRLDAIDEDLSRLESVALKAEVISSKFSAETRLSDATIAHELKQYDRASYLLLDVVSRTTPGSFRGYRQALYLLGDSLYQQRNYIGARNYLRQLRAMGPGDYYQDGLGKLLEIAYETNNYDGIEEIYSEMGSSSRPALSYLRARTLYEQGRYGDAAKVFKQAAEKPEFFYKGNYHAGVAHVELGQLDEAERLFAKVAERVPQTADDYHVYNLAHLARGRLAYEQEAYREALNHYTQVDRQDSAFFEAMYESAWANIQLEKYDQAQQMIDILVSGEPDVATYTKAMLLGADLAQRNEDYDRALEAYEKLLIHYDPVRAKVFEFAAAHPDLEGHFQTMITEDLRLQVPADLPNVYTDFAVLTPTQWLTENNQLRRARQLVDDVSLVKMNLRTAYEDLRQIETRLGTEGRLKSFPNLAEDVAELITVESRLIEIQRDLVNQQAAGTAAGLSASDAATWKEMKSELDLLHSRYEDIPRDVEELNARQELVNEDFEQLRERLTEVGRELDELKAQIAGAEVYMQTQQPILSEEESSSRSTRCVGSSMGPSARLRKSNDVCAARSR